MNLELTDDQRMMRESFAKLLDDQSSPQHVRAAMETDGFDQKLWEQLAELGAFAIRVDEAHGGLGMGVLDATVLMEEVGRRLVSGPVAEALVALRLLAQVTDGTHADIETFIAGSALLTMALQPIDEQPMQWVAGAAVASKVIALDGDAVVLIAPSGVCAEESLAGTPMAEVDFTKASKEVLAQGSEALCAFKAACEEWKLLMASAVSALAREAVRLASVYACEREAFGRAIGMYQAISHPLADSIVDIDGAKYLTWKAIHDIDAGYDFAAAEVSLALWWATEAAGHAVTRALHTFGGYGLALEYDVHLYNLRAKQWPLVAGDHNALLAEAGRRLYADEQVDLPDVGTVTIDFDRGEQAREMAAELEAFFERNLTPELRAKAHYSFDGFDWGMHKKLAEAGFLFPAWPKEYGGREAPPYVLNALSKVWEKYNWTTHATSTTNMVGTMIRKVGNDKLKSDVLPKIIAGDAICSLGYSEPSCGSDVFAAKTRAVQQADGRWRIDGSKMWTSGANIATYVLMLVRTNPDVLKHQGLTMFLVPLDSEGIEVQAVYTFQDERTNITYYDGVMVDDSYRLGEVDGGVKTMAAALELEHGGGFTKSQISMIEVAEAFCAEIQQGDQRLIDTTDAQMRLARCRAHAMISEVLESRALWAAVAKVPNLAYGPMIKMFSSEKFQSDSRDLLSLTAPHSLSKRSGPAGKLNLAYRHAHGTTIYGGTSEVHRSMIAERALGLPRTR